MASEHPWSIMTSHVRLLQLNKPCNICLSTVLEQHHCPEACAIHGWSGAISKLLSGRHHLSHRQYMSSTAAIQQQILPNQLPHLHVEHGSGDDMT